MQDGVRVAHDEIQVVVYGDELSVIVNSWLNLVVAIPTRVRRVRRILINTITRAPLRGSMFVRNDACNLVVTVRNSILLRSEGIIRSS